MDNSPAPLSFETTADEMAVRAQAAKVQLSAGVHVVRLQAPRHNAEGFRLDALLLASDDAAATAKLGLQGVHGAPGGALPAVVLPGGPALSVAPTVGGGRLPGVLIAGLPLSGAGLLLQQLAQHPGFVPHLDRLRPALHNALHEASHSPREPRTPDPEPLTQP